LDVYHTSTRGVALVRIYDAGLKRAARGSLKIFCNSVRMSHWNKRILYLHWFFAWDDLSGQTYNRLVWK